MIGADKLGWANSSVTGDVAASWARAGEMGRLFTLRTNAKIKE